MAFSTTLSRVSTSLKNINNNKIRNNNKSASRNNHTSRSLSTSATASTNDKNIVEIASANPDFSVLVEAVVKAKLATALSGPGPFTVLAPVNKAFLAALSSLKLSKEALLASPDLASILTFHVISGKVMSNQLSNGLEATTLEGGKVKFDLSGAGVKVNGANVILADVQASNGVIHFIDAVLLPPVKPEVYMKSLEGISLPFGYFDPVGLAAGLSVKEIKRYREAEITHGRVAMLATVGFLIGESSNPLFDGAISAPLAVNQFQQVPSPFWEVLVLIIGIAETGRALRGWVDPADALFELKDSYKPGDLGFDPLGFKPTDAAEAKEMGTKELANGRLAMLAIAAFVVHEEISGKSILQQGFPPKLFE